MAENALQQSLNSTFPKPDDQAWKKVAASEVEGNDPITRLAWQGADEIKFLPYYDRHSLNALSYLNNFLLSPSKNSFLGNRSWINMPNVHVSEETVSNEFALQHLRNGADGILFELKNQTTDFSKLFKEIEWNYCALSFHAKNAEASWQQLVAYVNQHVDANVITGAYFWNALPQIKISSIASAQFKSFGLVINSSTPVKQIVEALAQGVKMIELLSGEIDLQKIFERIAFSIPLSSDFLQEISKLKALRLLWYQVAQAYGVKNFVLEDLHIHARSETVTEEKYEPHSNMLKGTIAAMAAIIGGSDSLTVCAQHENNKMMDRIARNVSNILREESHLDKVSDPAAGSYVIENIVNDIAEKSWSEFQLIMKAS